MKMPEGWTREYKKAIYWNEEFYYQDREIKLKIYTLKLMQEMAEALEACGILYYESSSNLTEEDFKKPYVPMSNSAYSKMLEYHNSRALKAILILEKFKEWK